MLTNRWALIHILVFGLLITLLVAIKSFSVNFINNVNAQYPTPTANPTYPPGTEPIDAGTIGCENTASSSLDCGPIGAGQNQLYVMSVTIRGGNKSVQSVSGLGLTWSRAISQCSARNVQRAEIWTAYGTSVGGNV